MRERITIGSGAALCGVAIWMTFVLAGSAQTAEPAVPDRPVVHVNAERFRFTPSEIKLVVGDEVELRLKSDDTAHGFRLVGTDTDLVIPKRGAGETSFVFKAEKAGRWTFVCSRMCGAGHNFMRGEIVVTAPGGGVQP